MSTPVGPNSSFRVHLQSLVDIARDLEDQIEALRKPIDRLGVLGGHALPLGEFAEAATLRDHHLVASQQMHDLMVSVQRIIGFAADVTNTIAEGYAETDREAAGGFGRGESMAPTSAAGPPPALVEATTRTEPPTGEIGINVASSQPVSVTVDVTRGGSPAAPAGAGSYP